MVYASSANPSGKGNRGKVEGIGERIENAVDLVIEADDYVASIQQTRPLKLAMSKALWSLWWTRMEN